MGPNTALGIGGGLTLMAITAYGLKNKMGWKYWLFTLFFLVPTGAIIADQLDWNRKKKEYEERNDIHACKSQECRDKGGFLVGNGKCLKDVNKGYLSSNYIELNC